MARATSLSGYIELLPEERQVEQHALDTFRRVFELHGFTSVESRAVEPIDVLLGKGEIDKEVYAVSRIHDEAAAAKLALHFDLTVPFARYVTENAGHLDFPFRRYQIQKVWRGERPQAGRFREFTQADIDIVGEGELPFRCDVEIAVVMARALEALNIGGFTLRVNSRKLSEGFYRAIGLQDTAAVLRAVDKLDKVGAEQVAAELAATASASPEQAQKALALAQIRTPGSNIAPLVQSLLGDEHAAADTALLEEGIAELTTVMAELNERVPNRAVADLSIARGLDYYTGTVIETILHGHEELGSICSGGRYESLATKGKRTYPGVGLSIGVTRLLSKLLDAGQLQASRKVPTVVYVALNTDEDWPAAQDIADRLRARGINTEVALKAEKFGRQIKYADRRGIPYVWFSSADGHEVRDIRSGHQTEADPSTWTPPVEDLTPQIISTTEEL